MKWIELFSGAGLATEACKRADCEVVAAFELGYPQKDGSIDLSPLETYRLNHGNHVVQQDVRTVRGRVFEDKAVGIFGGPPCQDFSTANKQPGLKGESGSLILEFLRVAYECKSIRWILMENVPGILTSNYGQDLSIILSHAWSYGFRPAWRYGWNIAVDYHIFDAYLYGTPQRRKRVFFLWNKDGQSVHVPEQLYSWTGMGEALGVELKNDEPAPTLTAKDFPAGSREILKKMGLANLSLEQRAKLQGIPSSYKFTGSYKSVRRQIGNGWAVPLGRMIFEKIKDQDDWHSFSPLSP